jgi:hypothetical protein
MKKELTALIATSTALTASGCAIDGHQTYSGSRDIQTEVETSPRYARGAREFAVPDVLQNGGVQEIAPHKQSRYELATEVLFGEMYAAVPNNDQTNDELFFGLRWVNEQGSLRFSYDDSTTSLTSNGVYVPTRVLNGSGNGIESLSLVPNGVNGVRANVKLPNMEGIKQGTYTMQEGNVEVSLGTIIIEGTKMVNGQEQIFAREYFTPQGSPSEVLDFETAIVNNKRPDGLPFRLIPVEGTSLDVRLKDGLVTLNPNGNVYRPTFTANDSRNTNSENGAGQIQNIQSMKKSQKLLRQSTKAPVKNKVF